MITNQPTAASNLRTQLNLGYGWFAPLVAALGGLRFGRDWAFIGGAKPLFTSNAMLCKPTS